MDLIHSAFPYILLVGGLLLPLFTLIKEWKEYESSKLRRIVLVVLCLVSVLSLLSLHQENKDRRDAREESKRLEGQVESANRAQSDNTLLFLKSFKGLSDEVSDLKTQVRTDSLQKKLSSVQDELRITEKALAPSPKSSLAFSFDPVSYSADAKHGIPSSETTLDVDSEGAVHVQFFIMNATDIDAVDGDLNFVICDACKFAKEPDGFTRVTGQPETQRNMTFQRILARSMVGKTADIAVPSGWSSVKVGILYRCRTCIISSDPSSGTVHLRRDFLKKY